jgi:hypothetical protein
MFTEIPLDLRPSFNPIFAGRQYFSNGRRAAARYFEKFHSIQEKRGAKEHAPLHRFTYDPRAMQQ